MSYSNKNYCTLYLVRHGETEWNVRHFMQGHKDSPLTEQGLIQSAQTAQDLKGVEFDAIFSSDLLRATRTAEIIKLERKLAVQTSHLLREKSFGHFEGKPSEEFVEATKDLADQLHQLPESEKWSFKLDEDVESDEELVGRFITQLREIAVSSPGKNVLVVTHSGCIRIFVIKTGYATREQFPIGSFRNGGYVKVLSDGIDFFIEKIKGMKSQADYE
jgi:broad specificity phosphatase PhoE